MDAFIVEANQNALAKHTLMDQLLGEREAKVKQIRAIVFAAQANKEVIQFFEQSEDHGLYNQGQYKENYVRKCYMTASITDAEGAIRALDNSMWQKVMSMTNLETVFPAEVRKQWRENIDEFKMPEFKRENVQEVFSQLIANKDRFFAEKVDGVFKRLSKNHVTNEPSGFRSRMIYANALFPGKYLTSINRYFGEVFGDFVEVVALMAGYPAQNKYTWCNKLEQMYREQPGEWVSAMGGTFRVKVFKVGTVHVEVHPEIAARMNNVLASLYPAAIANSLRQPAKVSKDWPKWQNSISPEVLDALGQSEIVSLERGIYAVEVPESAPKHVKGELNEIFHQLGADGNVFDYYPKNVFEQIQQEGLLPDMKAFQFYPTPEEVARYSASLLEAEEHHTVLEPSAGTGALLKYVDVPANQITAVELSKVRCEALKQKGYGVVCEDFIEYKPDQQFDRIIMNPPYTKGQWQAHIAKALGHLKVGGVLVAVLPAGADVARNVNTNLYQVSKGEVFHKQFKYCSVNVQVFKIVRVG